MLCLRIWRLSIVLVNKTNCKRIFSISFYNERYYHDCLIRSKLFGEILMSIDNGKLDKLIKE